MRHLSNEACETLKNYLFASISIVDIDIGVIFKTTALLVCEELQI